MVCGDGCWKCEFLCCHGYACDVHVPDFGILVMKASHPVSIENRSLHKNGISWPTMTQCQYDLPPTFRHAVFDALHYLSHPAICLHHAVSGLGSIQMFINGSALVLNASELKSFSHHTNCFFATPDARNNPTYTLTLLDHVITGIITPNLLGWPSLGQLLELCPQSQQLGEACSLEEKTEI